MFQSQGSILSDRQIRALCEVPVAEIEFKDMRVRGVSNTIILPIFENEVKEAGLLVRHAPNLLRLAKVYGGEASADYGPPIDRFERYDDSWVLRQREAFKTVLAAMMFTMMKKSCRTALARQGTMFVSAVNLRSSPTSGRPSSIR